ncbi:MAG: DUF5063 domain-containing protein [Muribaculaceae bacterium]|nr:DUF5063 domain-containing protein [Muribaculaceae bacterium]
MSTLSNNEIAFLALANEFCATMENARESERDDFVGAMLRMLPRIYIAAADLRRDDTAISDAYVADALEEEYYDAVRMRVAELLGEDDTYLEVFEQDMKYSDTPIAASISEGLADLFQVFYNIVQTARDATPELIAELVPVMRDDFADYWSQTLCNVLRALNKLYYSTLQ